jgi:hypothetical protein
MESSFLSYLLCLSLALILIVYLNQLMNKSRTIHHKSKHQLNPHLYKTHTQNINSALPTIKKQNELGMPIHRVGPVINFHQHFNKYNPSILTQYGHKTGIPEMGFRNLYLSNFSKNEVKEDDPFSGIMTRNYLDNMDSVDNIYRHVL